MTIDEIDEIINNEFYSNSFEPKNSKEAMKTILDENRANKEKNIELSERIEKLEKKVIEKFEIIEGKIVEMRDENSGELKKLDDERKEEMKKINDDIFNINNRIKEFDANNKNSFQNIQEENNKISEKLKITTETLNEYKQEIEKINEMSQKIEKLNQIIENHSDKISKLEKDTIQNTSNFDANNKNIKEQIEEIKKTIKPDEKNANSNSSELNNLIEKVNKITSLAKEDNFFNKALFHQLNGEMQLSILNELNATNYTENFSRIGGLLGFLSSEFRKAKKQDKQANYVFIPAVMNTSTDKKDNYIIGVSSSMTEILYQNRSLESPQFSNFIENFSEFYLEIKYPSTNYEKIYKIALNYKKSHSSKLQYLSVE